MVLTSYVTQVQIESILLIPALVLGHGISGGLGHVTILLHHDNDTPPDPYYPEGSANHTQPAEGRQLRHNNKMYNLIGKFSFAGDEIVIKIIASCRLTHPKY